MLSYRHAFHAGNHADVLKHIALVLALDYLVRKEKPLWYIDTHAGAGSYRLTDAPATQNAEYETGVARLLAAAAAAPAELQPWLRGLSGCMASGKLVRYPGSPAWAASMLRSQDRLELFEMHPQDGAALARHFAKDKRARMRMEDGFAGLKAMLPPPSRRALALIDPPYEIKTDYEKVLTALRDAHRRFASGVYLLWYPLLNRPESRRLAERLPKLGLGPWLHVQLQVAAPGGGFGMYGSGLFVVNPPWQLQAQLGGLLPWVARELAGANGTWRLTAAEQ